MTATIGYSFCNFYVVGIDMNCPLCGELVRSGQQHACSGNSPAKKAAKKAAVKKAAAKKTDAEKVPAKKTAKKAVKP